jgi:tol-pal system protein YbgF
MRLVTKGVFCIILFTLAGCASRGDLDIVQGDMNELKTRLFAMGKDMDMMRSETKAGIEQSLKGSQQDVNALRKAAADLQATLDSSRVDMQALAGQVDDVRIMARKPADDIALLKEDTDKRMTVLTERVEKLEKNTLDLQNRLAELKTVLAEKNPEDLYQKGLATFKGGDMTMAREQFSKFLEANPKHELTANARYWLGETYYRDKNYDQAILEFQEVIKNFPTKEKAPSAMLKQAMSFKELGDAKSANFIFKKLIESYPQSEEARLASEKLKHAK